MNQLIIHLAGAIEDSNFLEWKQDLLAHIHSVNTELATDDDFVDAENHVKFFKEAEKTLKEAKQSAIEQAADIQQLFASIDEISEEARQIRLALQRQIKTRKLEIKEEVIQQGIEVVRSCIQQQSDGFQRIDHSIYLERTRFDQAVKGKVALHRLRKAVASLIQTIEKEIESRAEEVSANLEKLEALPEPLQLLFQDRNSLIGLNTQELSLTIDKRIALHDAEQSKRKLEKTANVLKKFEDAELNPDANVSSEQEIPQNEKYQLVIDLFASKESAIEIARTVRSSLVDSDSVVDIRLTRVFDE